MLKKVLIANRGEIALRIVRALHDLGMESVAIYSEADSLSRHVRYADEAYCVGPAEASESYLNVARILEIAAASGADAIHPGYGFLAENADFAEACEEAGLTFIGPSPSSIRLLGNKNAARSLAESVGVPVVPGSGPLESFDAAPKLALEIGYPIAIKATAGGGGRGIRFVDREEDLSRALSLAAREAKNAFGDGTIYLEAQMEDVRHIEVQIIGDNFGNVIPLGERECSIQRRHQKIIEETPSMVVGPRLRRTLNRAAVRVARAAGYRSAGTVEFLLDEEGRYYFLEVNARLQVEHPVTEMTTGVDLVRDQLLIGGGSPLSYDEGDLSPRGWAIECRIVAEDPANNFLPSVGRVVFSREPAGPGVRVESCLHDGLEVTPYYDSLLAKVTAWGADREDARARMIRALHEFQVVGVATNIPYLLEILELRDFIDGQLDTGFLDKHKIVGETEEQEQIYRDAAAIAAILTFAGGNSSVTSSPREKESRRASAWRQKAMGRWPKSI
ncbi:MAG TPA: acetyl-CoA carboxylase biotin carboxylase subunit [Dehalococcoidia bacterium]|nr:acetyl-CoA carboxylase biotin carboxylase subunit [Dehalococcoidia bacterium]